MDTQARIKVITFAVLILASIVLWGTMMIATHRKASWHNGLLVCMLTTGIAAFGIFSEQMQRYSLLVTGIGMLVMFLVVFFTYQKDQPLSGEAIRYSRTVLRWMGMLTGGGALLTMGATWFVMHQADQKELIESNQDVALAVRGLSRQVYGLDYRVANLESSQAEDRAFKVQILTELGYSRQNQTALLKGRNKNALVPQRVTLPHIQPLSPRQPAKLQQSQPAQTLPDTIRQGKPKKGVFNWLKGLISVRDTSAYPDSTYMVQVQNFSHSYEQK
ncbi:hypothetical protein [Spirosoma fluviale]|uniref:Uncharacterized protein n=1 Tax=Spirosoma fluviale TaxID=1597977 RepID=A0A286FDY2_9BACT|nr:hypothetical protein [Spirosoma fluviale]SOD81034.1 hypothetical protein SAMN06269250_1652 [Spirosoma fluviale]